MALRITGYLAAFLVFTHWFPETPPKVYPLKVLPSVLQETKFSLVENQSVRAMNVTLNCKVYLE